MLIDSRALTAIVLNFRTPDLTLRAARALIADGLPAQRLVVVDNASADDSVKLIAGALPGSIVLELPESRGFAAGNNAGAERLPGDAYLFVNSDAFAEAGAIETLLARLDAGRAGLVVPRLRNEDGSLQRNVVPRTSLARELTRASGAGLVLRHPGWSTHWAHDEPRRIDCAIGAVVLVRGDAWDALGGFDERRFMYAEDLDLFWRARARGLEAWFEPGAEFVHLGGATSSRQWSLADRAATVAEAEGEMIRAHTARPLAVATLGVMAAGTGARAVLRRALGHREQADALAAFTRGYLRQAWRRRSG